MVENAFKTVKNARKHEKMTEKCEKRPVNSLTVAGDVSKHVVQLESG
jgi:hypothetical protein